MKFYLVGGAVRDNLLGLHVRDKDWLVVGSTYKKMISLGFKPVGNYFPVFIHPVTKEEYSMARTEIKNGHGYNGFICCFSKHTSLKEDLYRRDITINAIAIDKYGFYYDPYGGIDDLKNRVIRHVSLSFLDDPLRVLRVAQFFSRLSIFNFYIHKNTFCLMENISSTNELYFISSERIWNETEKALNSLNPSLYFLVLYKCNALKKIFPEISFFYNNKKLYYYFSSSLKKSVLINSDIEVRFVLMCCFFYETIFSDIFYKNKNILNKVLFFCKRLKVSNKFFNLCKLFFLVIYKIYFYKGKDYSFMLIDILNYIDIWRKPKLIYKFITLMKIIKYLPLKNKNIYFFLDDHLLNIFLIFFRVESKYIVSKKDIKGFIIKKKIQDFRLKIIRKYLILNVIKTY